jgi:catechol 2,3-dioxygenase-like lactoylglutathione lyase family enzyme
MTTESGIRETICHVRNTETPTTEEDRMSLSSVQIVTVWVRDRNDALDFYTGKLGLEVGMDETFGEGQRFLTVATPGGGTQIALTEGDGSRVGGMTGIVFGSTNPAATHAELTARGVEFTEPPTEQEWGALMGMFADPDGNVFVLHSAAP